MEQTIISSAATQGLWALLFVMLLFYVLRTNEKRELRLQDIINKLTDKFDILQDVKNDVDDIKDYIRR